MALIHLRGARLLVLYVAPWSGVVWLFLSASIQIIYPWEEYKLRGWCVGEKFGLEKGQSVLSGRYKYATPGMWKKRVGQGPKCVLGTVHRAGVGVAWSSSCLLTLLTPSHPRPTQGSGGSHIPSPARITAPNPVLVLISKLSQRSFTLNLFSPELPSLHTSWLPRYPPLLSHLQEWHRPPLSSVG